MSGISTLRLYITLLIMYYRCKLILSRSSLYKDHLNYFFQTSIRWLFGEQIEAGKFLLISSSKYQLLIERRWLWFTVKYDGNKKKKIQILCEDIEPQSLATYKYRTRLDLLTNGYLNILNKKNMIIPKDIIALIKLWHSNNETPKLLCNLLK